ncbi:solute carrier family 40 member 3 chloroplastic [Prunus yedoensis var. nudiflora]|uniref:Solute carrier family 40 member n=1 Tax=Prunus yedoensis var. nudiflora TaxID=2094558 RepID=A0A314Z397_PRUYE|nr:solute carrier family 40 member 3 chloroplastic [Prunus yedoensis var. nudiflora]
MALGCGCTVPLSQYSLSFKSFNLFSACQASFPSAPPRPSSRICYRIASRRWLNLNHISVGSRRFHGFSSRCSITNTDIHFSHVATENEVQEETSAAEPDCSIVSDDTARFIKRGAAYPCSYSGPSNGIICWEFSGATLEFCLALAIALIYPSLLPVAFMGFFSKLAIIAGGPLVGTLMDHFPRVPAYNCLNIIQATAQLLSAAMIIHAHSVPPSVSPLLLRPWFIVLVLAGAVERLSGVALGVAMERDWVVLELTGLLALAQANAILNRIDLLCEIAGASLFGFFSLSMIGNMLEVCRRFNGVVVAFCMDKGVAAIKLGWKEYMQQPVLPASLAYVLLYFNVVLTPGSLMTAYLTQSGLNPSIIGGFSGLCAFMGVAATFVSSCLVRRLGILKVLSRLGHMSYDVVAVQILQTGIPSSKANIIGTTEVAVASLAEFTMWELQ